MSNYQNAFDKLLESGVYGVPQIEKEKLLGSVLRELDVLHRRQCPEYGRMFELTTSNLGIEELPYIAVRLFKLLALKSVAQDDVFRVLQSSGTTAQTPAQVFLDKQTSARQSKVLVKVLQDTIGKQRLPMLIIDSPSVLRDKSKFNARGAGIQGLSFFGRDHTYALDDDMNPDWQAIEAFEEKYRRQPVLLFGFTFMVWLYFVKALQRENCTLSFEQGVLLHSGGWKKLIDQQVNNEVFKQGLKEVSGIQRVHNFYGMAEQVGSVFVECEHGHLHAPVFADVIVRDPFTLLPAETGREGLLQVLSAIPTSYPGHSILTEDLGVIEGIDDCTCGRKGKYFRVTGRLPKTEVRGCSDTHGGSL